MVAFGVAWARSTNSRDRMMRERMSTILEGHEGQQGEVGPGKVNEVVLSQFGWRITVFLPALSQDDRELRKEFVST
jgi:hypothetical protein